MHLVPHPKDLGSGWRYFFLLQCSFNLAIRDMSIANGFSRSLMTVF